MSFTVSLLFSGPKRCDDVCCHRYTVSKGAGRLSVVIDGVEAYASVSGWRWRLDRVSAWLLRTFERWLPHCPACGDSMRWRRRQARPFWPCCSAECLDRHLDSFIPF
jgi:hypothetical protein